MVKQNHAQIITDESESLESVKIQLRIEYSVFARQKLCTWKSSREETPTWWFSAPGNLHPGSMGYITIGHGWMFNTKTDIRSNHYCIRKSNNKYVYFFPHIHRLAQSREMIEVKTIVNTTPEVILISRI